MVLASLSPTIRFGLCPTTSGRSPATSPCKLAYAATGLSPGRRRDPLGASSFKFGLKKDGRALDVRLKAGDEIEVEAQNFPWNSGDEEARKQLVIGSPIVIVEPPPLLKTAEPMPMMRPNRGLIKAGDAGRILDRRPKDVWAIRFAVGAYLVDGKYFEPLLEE